MALVIAKFSIPLVLAAILGLMVGQATCSAKQMGARWSWIPWAIAAAVAGLFMALLTLLPGRQGLWLETALLMLGAYLAGCCVTCMLNSLAAGSQMTAERNPLVPDYTMKVARVDTIAAPALAATVPFGSTPDTATAVANTFALRSSATDFTIMAAAVNTTVATALAQQRNPSIAAEAERRRLLANRPDNYALVVAGIDTLAGRDGVIGPLRTVETAHAQGYLMSPERGAAAGVSAMARARSAATRGPAASYTLAVAGLGTLAGREGVPHAVGAGAAMLDAPPMTPAPDAPARVARVASPAMPPAHASQPAPMAGSAMTMAATTDSIVAVPPPPTARAAMPVAAAGNVPAAESAHAAAPTGSAKAANGMPGQPPLATAVDGVKPLLLPAPRNGRKDDLSLIWGVAEKLEQRMNHMGIWHFDQIAQWTPEHVTWFEATVEGFKGRIERDKWIEQCAKLAEGWRPSGSIGQRPKG